MLHSKLFHSAFSDSHPISAVNDIETQWIQRDKKQRTELDRLYKKEQRARTAWRRPELVFNCEVIGRVSEIHRQQPSPESFNNRNFAYAENQITREPWSIATSRAEEATYAVTFPDNTVVSNVLGRELEPLWGPACLGGPG